MIERWCRRAWSSLELAVARGAERMKRVRPGVWIVLLVVLGVVGLESGRLYQRLTGHRTELADAIGSVGFFYGPPQPEHSGSRALYLRTSEKGLGFYACEVASGKVTLLQDWQAPGGRSFRGQSLWPLSPNDRFIPLVVSVQATPGALAICDAGSGKEVARLAEPGWIVTQGAWLTPEKLAWLRRRNPEVKRPEPFELHLTERQPDGRWADQIAGVTLTNVSCLTALSGDTIAWMDAKGIYALNLASSVISPLFSAPGKQIAELNYSREHQQFLVTCKEKQGRSVWRLELKADAPNDFSRLTSDKNIRRAQWVNDGAGYAYLSRDTMVVKADAAASRVEVKAAVDTLVAAPTGDGLFFVGSVGHEPGLGLWRYRASDQSLTNLVCYSDRPSSRARRVEPVRCVANDAAGHLLHYYLYRPVNFNWRRKYPLLIGDTVFGQFAYQRDFDGPSWAEAMANCGAYVVIVARKDWFPKDDQEWGRGVMTLYNYMRGEPTIDYGRIFLYGASLETSYLSRLIEQKPELWRGALLLNPGELPDLTAIKAGRRLPRILISAGKEEGETERFKKYQEEACARGILVEVVEHPNSAHVLTSIPASRGRIVAMKDFVFEE